MASLMGVLNLKSIVARAADRSLSVKASLNAVAAALDYGARLVVGFVINPILVIGLGDFGYGVWQVLGRLMGYITPASGRPQQTLKWALAHHQSSADHDEKRRFVGAAVAVWLLFMPAMAVVGGVLGWFAPTFLHSPDSGMTSTIRLAAGLLVANFIVRALVGLPRSVLEGQNLGYKRMGWSAVLVVVGGGLTVLALQTGLGLVGVAGAQLATTFLTGLLFFQVAHRSVDWFGIARPSWASVRRFMGLTGWFLVWNLVMRLMRASDVVVLGVLASAELVTVYALMKYVPETLIQLVAVVVLGISPGLGGIIGSGDVEKAARIRGEIMGFTWITLTAAGATVLLWNGDFVRLWVGSEYDAGALPTFLILLTVAQLVLIRNDASIIDLTLKLRSKVLLGVASTVLSLVLASVLVGSFGMGIVGVCIGFVAGRAILTVAYPWLVGVYLRIPWTMQVRGLVRPAIVSVVLFVVASRLDRGLVATTWPGLVLAASVTAVMFVSASFFLGLTATQRGVLWKRLGNLGRVTKGGRPA